MKDAKRVSIEALIARYGIATIFVGAGIEGEVVVMTGGILAHHHLFPLWEAMLAATAGSFTVDQTWFLLGRNFQGRPWVAKAMARPTFGRALEILERHPVGFIFGFRFVYGLRTISPIAIGTTRVPAVQFMLLNALAAMIWAPLFTYIGYRFGEVIDPFLREIRHEVLYSLSAVATLALLVGAFRRLNHRMPLARKTGGGKPGGIGSGEVKPECRLSATPIRIAKADCDHP